MGGGRAWINAGGGVGFAVGQDRNSAEVGAAYRDRARLAVEIEKDLRAFGYCRAVAKHARRKALGLENLGARRRSRGKHTQDERRKGVDAPERRQRMAQQPGPEQ